MINVMTKKSLGSGDYHHIIVTKGGKGSGDWKRSGHAGRPGLQGGASPTGYKKFANYDHDGMHDYIVANRGVESGVFGYASEFPAVAWYCEDGCLHINSYLRFGNSEDISADVGVPSTHITIPEAIRQMDTFVQKGTIPENTILYRGMTSAAFPNVDRLKGKIIKDKAFVSTSLDESQATEAAGYYSPKRWHGYLAEIRVHKGQHAGMIDTSEHEIILPRNTRFKVVDIIKTHVPGLGFANAGYDETRLILEVVK